MLPIGQKHILGRKVVCVRCINCSYKNIAKDICLLDKKKHFSLYRKYFKQVRTFEGNISLIMWRFVRIWTDILDQCQFRSRINSFA